MKKFLKINERLPLRLQTYIPLLSYFQFELVSHLHNFRIGIPIGIPKEFLRNPQEFFGLLLTMRVDVCKVQVIVLSPENQQNGSNQKNKGTLLY